VVVRAISSDLHLDYTAVGQTSHLAARMEQLASPGTTLLAADTLRLVEGYVEVRPLGAMPVKGLPAPVEAYELVGTGPRRSRFAAAAARGLTRFVGRDVELDQLREALDSAASGRGQVVAIVGEPGVGKSRLVWEVTHSHRTYGWLVLQAGGVSYDKTTSYLPVLDLLKGYLQIGDRDDPRTIREKVTGKLLALDRALEPELPALLALLDVPVEDRRWEVLDPPQRRLRTLEAVKRLFVRESQAQPLLVVCEDLHWIDAETQAALDRLVESLATTRILLLVNYRPEYRHDWGGKTYYRQLRLDPLGPEGAEELLETLLGGDAGLAPLKQLLIARTEGNPFFLEENVRSLVDDGVLAGKRGAYRLATTVEQVQVPATVRAILAARIDRLPAEDKNLLQMASIIGKDVPVAVLAAVAAEPADVLFAGLARLQAAEFLYETRMYPDAGYTFKHALTHEVAYGSLLQERRRALHVRTVEAIESLYPERLAEHVERLAHHALRGEVWEKAVAFLQQAGTKAVQRSAHREATAAFELALDTLRHLPQEPEWRARAIDLHLDASSELLVSGERTKSIDHSRQAAALAESLGDERRLGRALAFLAIRAWTWMDSERARDLGQRALAIADRLNDVSVKTSVNYYLGWSALTRGDYKKSAEIFRKSAGTLHDDHRNEWLSGPGLASVVSRAWSAWSHAEMGEFAEAIACGEEALRIAREADHPASLVYADRSLGFVFLRRGAVPQAIPPLERAVELCRVAEVWILFDITAALLGYVYALSGRLPEGLTLMEEALADPEATGTTHRPLLLACLAELHLLAGRRCDAVVVARRALDMAHRQQERGNEAWVLRLFGDIAARADPPDMESAEEHYTLALARANELGMRPLAAHCHFRLGTLYGSSGDHAKAQEQLTFAATMYREMDMGFWLDKVEAELGSRL
jgi:tetratricopeptide (TPR) repeat protein